MVDQTLVDALPGYDLGGELGRGAMGEVIAGRHRKLDRDVAVKRLPKTFALDPTVVERFGAEARLLAALSHPHIVPVYDYVEDKGLCLLVMQALPGGTVWDRFRSEGLTMPSACAILIATCAGLQHAHDKRVLHRDIKPENLLFDADNTVKVADFGIATVLGGDETLATLDGDLIGTPAYMAPEQADGSAVGPGADVYAAGTMLYELLSGRLPFSEEGGSVALLQRRLHDAPTDLREVAPTVPAELAAVTMRAIERDPAQRYGRADELGAAVADAATAAWGDDWLAEVDLRLLADVQALGTGRRTAAAASPAVDAAADPLPEPSSDAAGDARATQLRGSPAASAPASRPTVEAGAKVLSQRGTGEGPLDLRGVDPREVVPLRVLLAPPPPPTRDLLVAGACLVAALVLAIVGLWVPSPSSSPDRLPPGITVAGEPVPTDGVITVDLGRPVPVHVPSRTPGAASAALDLTVMGASLARSDQVPFRRDRAGGWTASPSIQTAQAVTSGQVQAKLVVADAFGRPTSSTVFTLESDQPALLSLTGFLAALLLLVVAAYATSTSKPLRLGREKPSAHRGLAVLGALGGIDLVLWGWALGLSQPTWLLLAVAAALGAGAGWFGSRALLVLGRRRRLDEALRSL